MSTLLVLKLSDKLAGYRVEAFFMDTHYWGEEWGLGVGFMGHLIHLGLSKCVKIIFKVELEMSKLDWPIHIT